MLPAVIAAVAVPIILHFRRLEKSPKPLIITYPTFEEAPLLPGINIGAAASQFSVSFSDCSSFQEADIKIAYNIEGQKICILTKTNSS
jgi:hypothetical protein